MQISNKASKYGELMLTNLKTLIFQKLIPSESPRPEKVSTLAKVKPLNQRFCQKGFRTLEEFGTLI